MAVLVTGGAGFIGSQLALRLLDLGEDVVILDNFDDYYSPAIKRANIASLGDKPVVIEGDIRDEALVDRLFREHHITRVAHLAALAGVRASVNKGRLYSDVNTAGSVNLMDASRKYGVEVFVQGSTSSVYGHTTQVPFVETDAADRPLAPYPASKRAAELMGYSYHHLFDLNVTCLRFFNVYGPHGRPDMMPLKVIESILNDQTITVYQGGELQRDWTFVDDIVSGVIAALGRPIGFEVINLGFGAPISLIKFIQIYEGLIGKTAKQQSVPVPLTEPLITYCDNSRARALLGFAPQVDIREGLARTWAWYRERYKL